MIVQISIGVLDGIVVGLAVGSVVGAIVGAVVGRVAFSSLVANVVLDVSSLFVQTIELILISFLLRKYEHIFICVNSLFSDI
jgi:hypothetical protein